VDEFQIFKSVTVHVSYGNMLSFLFSDIMRIKLSASTLLLLFSYCENSTPACYTIGSTNEGGWDGQACGTRGRYFYMGHPVVMRINKVNNNCQSQLSSFCMMYGLNSHIFGNWRPHIILCFGQEVLASCFSQLR
jgi:hypothetical protein